MAEAFSCPPDCGWCCTHLHREVPAAEARATRGFRAVLRDLGVYTCGDAVTTGLSLSPGEAAALGAEAERRGLRTGMHPRTFLLETRRRVAVVLDWHLPRKVCPFYADFRCTAYEARPLVCRAYPVLAPAPRWGLAPECPKVAPIQGAVAEGALRLGTHLRAEGAARRAIEARGASVDEDAMRLLETPGARFARGLPRAQAEARARRWRRLSPQEFEALARPA